MLVTVGNHIHAGAEVNRERFSQREGIEAWRSSKQFANLRGIP
jgi:hypothetical protein